MKRLLFSLVFAALITPFAAADSIDYQGAGNSKNTVVVGSASSGNTWSVTDELVQIDDVTTGQSQSGQLGRFDITTGILSSCASGLCFTGGNLDIDNNSGVDLVDLSFTKGSISVSNGITTLQAFLPGGAATLIKLTNGSYSSQALVGSPVPEVTTLGLFGTGLIALGAAFFRRKNLQEV